MDGSSARYQIPYMHANDKSTHDEFVEILTDLPELLRPRVSPFESDYEEDRTGHIKRRMAHLADTLLSEFPTVVFKYPHYCPPNDILYAIPFSDDVTDSDIFLVMALWSLVCLLTLAQSRDIQVRNCDLIHHHCQVIINTTASIVDFQDVYCFGTSIVPLKAVLLNSPDLQQRDHAMSLIQRLGGAFRFDGLLGATE